MRNEPSREPDAEHQDARTSPDGRESHPFHRFSTALGGEVATSVIDAPLLQTLRDRRRRPDASALIGKEILRLATIAAGLHRAEVAGRVRKGETGTPLAKKTSEPTLGCGGTVSAEDAA